MIGLGKLQGDDEYSSEYEEDEDDVSSDPT
jgi:hypothetical protein